MDKKLRGAAVVGQSGGPTAAINATLAGVIRACLADGETFSRIYGMRNGIDGFLEGRFLDLGERFTTPGGEVDEDALCLLSVTPSAALGSCRKKLPDPEADPGFFERLIASFASLDIRYFFYIGGNDSMDTVAKLSKYVSGSDYEMRVIGVPKTIDNDVDGTDHTPGFGSAAKYIATVSQEITVDCSVYTTKAVTIVEFMGRDAGWLTAAAALPRLTSGLAPDYVYLPEVAFSMEGFVEDIEDAWKKHPNIVIAVSEGLRFADGHYVGEGTQSGATDVFGHKYLEGTGKALEIAVKEKFGCKVRSIEINLPQRCASHIRSATDISESRSCGIAAVKSALSGHTGQMIAMIREASDEYRIKYASMDVANNANAVKSVPRDFINERGNNVTDECLEYILPLIQGEIETKFEKGLPKYITL